MSRRLLRRLKKVGGWVAAIVGSIIASLVVYQLTKEPAQAPAPPVVVLADSASGGAISRAHEPATLTSGQAASPNAAPSTSATANAPGAVEAVPAQPTQTPARIVSPPVEAPVAAAPCVARIVAVDGASEIPAAGADVVLRRGNRQCIKGRGSQPISITVEVCGGRVAPSPEFLVDQNSGRVEFAYTAWVTDGGAYRQVAFRDDQYGATTIRPRADGSRVRLSFALEESVPEWEICALVPGDY